MLLLPTYHRWVLLGRGYVLGMLGYSLSTSPISTQWKNIKTCNAKNTLWTTKMTWPQRICYSHWANGALNGVISIGQWGVFNHEKGAI